MYVTPHYQSHTVCKSPHTYISMYVHVRTYRMFSVSLSASDDRPRRRPRVRTCTTTDCHPWHSLHTTRATGIREKVQQKKRRKNGKQDTIVALVVRDEQTGKKGEKHERRSASRRGRRRSTFTSQETAHHRGDAAVTSPQAPDDDEEEQHEGEEETSLAVSLQLAAVSSPVLPITIQRPVERSS